MNDPNPPIDTHRGRLLRADKVMTPGEIDDFLKSAFCARIATVDPDGYPYILPNLFTWLDGQIYLHTSRRPGHFIANVRHANRACVEVDAPGEVFPYGHIECDTSVSYASVVLFGRIRVIDNETEQQRFYTAFMTKYAPADSWGREKGSFPRMGSTIVYAISPEVVTGKRGHLPARSEQWPARNLTASPDWPAPKGTPAK